MGLIQNSNQKVETISPSVLYHRINNELNIKEMMSNLNKVYNLRLKTKY